MIKVTRLNGKVFAVNSELIEFIEETPDTVVSLQSGRKIVVAESLNEIIERVVEYKGLVISRLAEKKSPEGD